jgi:hypothetical protein
MQASKAVGAPVCTVADLQLAKTLPLELQLHTSDKSVDESICFSRLSFVSLLCNGSTSVSCYSYIEYITYQADNKRSGNGNVGNGRKRKPEYDSFGELHNLW